LAGAGQSAVPWDTLIDPRGFLRTWPQREDADAFFAARLRRADVHTAAATVSGSGGERAR
jgi:hypothetical protein